MQKDAAELLRQPGAVLPGLLMVGVGVLPVLLISTVTRSGEDLGKGELVEAAQRLALTEPALRGLEGIALAQSFFFHQFFLLLPMVPVVASMALAAHAVVGEKQARALEPLLATPLKTTELLAAKTLTPFLVSLALLAVAVGLYLAGVAATAEPGVWPTLITPRTCLIVGALAPLVSLAGLQSAVLLSSRTNDPRTAQQLGGLLLVPLTAAFVAQLAGQLVLGLRVTLIAIALLALANAALLLVGVRVFDRETILMRWK